MYKAKEGLEFTHVNPIKTSIDIRHILPDTVHCGVSVSDVSFLKIVLLSPCF